jgi:hypothetical protein
MTARPLATPPKFSRIRPLHELRRLPDEAIINVTEASLLLGKHPETIRRWRKLKVGPRHLRHPIYINHIEYLIGDVRAWIMGRFSQPSSDPQSLWGRSVPKTSTPFHKNP